MNSSLRWPLLAVVLGLVTAFALWGPRRAGAPGSGPAQSPVPPAPPPTQTTTGVTPALPKTSISSKGHGATQLRFQPDIADFGEVPVNESRTMDVTITNPTAKSITLTDFRPTCGCLTAEMKQVELAPGKTAPMTLKIVALPGRKKESLHLYFKTNEPPTDPICLIEVRIKVREELSVDPNMLRFDYVNKNEPKTLETVIRSSDGKPFSIKTVAGTRPEFTFKWEPIEGGAAYKIFATLKGDKGGLIAESVGVVTDRVKAGTATLNVSGTINPDLKCLPASVNAQADEERRVPAFTTVISRITPGRLDVTEILESANPPGLPIEYTVDRLTEGSCRLSIKFKNPYMAPAPFGQFLIKTNVEEEAFRLPYRVNGLPTRVPPGSVKIEAK